MSLKIVLAEKPSVGREIARVLKCKNNKGSYIEGNGYIVTWARVLKCKNNKGSYIEGNGYIVTWALGHLVGLMDPEGYGDKYKKWSMETLPMLPKPMKLTVLKKTSKQYNEVKKQLLRNDVDEIIIATDAGREGELVARWIIDKVGLMDPEGYGDKYKKWSMETLPMLPKPMKLTVLKKTSKQYNEVKKQLLRNDVDEIIIATDAGREGELVARWIIDKSGVRKKIKRLWISSQTDKAILDGFKNLKDGRAYDNLYKAAVCRAEADWLVGLNVTRALTCKYNAQLSAGRVQSPTLAMIVNREEEIKNFKPEDYYNLKALTDKFTLSWVIKQIRL